MNTGVAITGMGIISSIGDTVAENFEALKNSRHGISRVENIQTIQRGEIMVGEIKYTNEELVSRLNLSRSNNYSRTSLLGLIAVEEAVKSAGITDFNRLKTGIVSATSVGGMDMTEKYFYKYLEEKTFQRYIESHHLGDTAQKIAARFGIKESLVTTISTACSSAANAILFGARLIRSGRLDRVIVGGTDSLSKFTINGFKSLMILSDSYSTPFDENRKGLNLGEAAAFLVLESEKTVKKENKKVLGYVKGYGNANDAFHQTASSEHGDGATLAMEKALKTAGIHASEIDYINAHGTATVNNDLSEGRAFQRVFGETVPDFSSTKAFTGHTLAAAGAVEAVYCLLSLESGLIFPNLNFRTPMKEFDLIPVQTVKEKNPEIILSNSLGFGGNCSTVIFSKNP